jgi:HEAT repeat protein
MAFVRALALAVLILASSRAHVPMGTAIRSAATIAIVDVADGKVTFRELLKGTAREPVPFDRGFPRDAKGVALLLGADGQVLEVYTGAPAIEALRTLVPLYAAGGSERARLVAVRALLLRVKQPELAKLYREQLVSDFKSMRERENLPLVIELFERCDELAQRDAIDVLAFIGDPRAVPLLVRALQSPHKWVAIEAQTALDTHFPGNAPPRKPAPLNDYRRVVQLLERGDEAATRPLFLHMLDDREQLEAAIHFLPDWLERMIATHPKEAGHIREVLLPILDRLARSDNSLWKEAAARTLRELRHPSTAPALFALLEPRDPLFDRSRRIAAYALYDLGDPLRAAAIAKLPPGAFDAQEWKLYRLGEMRDARAVATLVGALRSGYPRQRTATEALVRIGGPRVEEAMQPLLRDPALDVRRAAMEVLFSVQRERFLPALRRMLVEPGFGDVPAALTYLAHFGDASDLKVLVPRSDFWTGDRENHYWLMMAIAELRRRLR